MVPATDPRSALTTTATGAAALLATQRMPTPCLRLIQLIRTAVDQVLPHISSPVTGSIRRISTSTASVLTGSLLGRATRTRPYNRALDAITERIMDNRLRVASTLSFLNHALTRGANVFQWLDRWDPTATMGALEWALRDAGSAADLGATNLRSLQELYDYLENPETMARISTYLIPYVTGVVDAVIARIQGPQVPALTDAPAPLALEDEAAEDPDGVPSPSPPAPEAPQGWWGWGVSKVYAAVDTTTETMKAVANKTAEVAKKVGTRVAQVVKDTTITVGTSLSVHLVLHAVRSGVETVEQRVVRTATHTLIRWGTQTTAQFILSRALEYLVLNQGAQWVTDQVTRFVQNTPDDQNEHIQTVKATLYWSSIALILLYYRGLLIHWRNNRVAIPTQLSRMGSLGTAILPASIASLPEYLTLEALQRESCRLLRMDPTLVQGFLRGLRDALVPPPPSPIPTAEPISAEPLLLEDEEPVPGTPPPPLEEGLGETPAKVDGSSPT